MDFIMLMDFVGQKFTVELGLLADDVIAALWNLGFPDGILWVVGGDSNDRGLESSDSHARH